MSESRAKIEKIAAAQKLLLWAILANIVVNLSAIGLRSSMDSNPPNVRLVLFGTIGLLQIGIVILQIVAVMKLSLALDEGWATVFYVVFQCIPCLNLILLLFLNGRATNRLKAAGIRVGLMGANSTDIVNYRPQARKCPACGEPVEADALSCPMCGKPL